MHILNTYILILPLSMHQQNLLALQKKITAKYLEPNILYIKKNNISDISSTILQYQSDC